MRSPVQIALVCSQTLVGTPGVVFVCVCVACVSGVACGRALCEWECVRRIPGTCRAPARPLKGALVSRNVSPCVTGSVVLDICSYMSQEVRRSVSCVLPCTAEFVTGCVMAHMCCCVSHNMTTCGTQIHDSKAQSSQSLFLFHCVSKGGIDTRNPFGEGSVFILAVVKSFKIIQPFLFCF